MQARSRSTKQQNDTLLILFTRSVRNVEEEYIDQTTLWTSSRKLIKSKIQTKISLEKRWSTSTSTHVTWLLIRFQMFRCYGAFASARIRFGREREKGVTLYRLKVCIMYCPYRSLHKTPESMSQYRSKVPDFRPDICLHIFSCHPKKKRNWTLPYS